MMSTASNVDTRDSNAKGTVNLLEENKEVNQVSSVPLVQNQTVEGDIEIPRAS